MKPLLHFFDNKVKLVLQNKHIVKGLIKHIDYEAKTLTLIEVEDWGSEEGADHRTVPVNAKYNEKVFEIGDILEVEYDNKHFKDESKKYIQDDFFDNFDSDPPKRQFDKPRFQKKYVEKRYRND